MMGTMLNASCKECGYEKEFNYGGGMMDFMEVCTVPAMDINTNELIEINILDNNSFNQTIVPYINSGMYKGSIKKDFYEWGEIRLKKCNNLCPKCKKYSLDFNFLACYD